MFSRKISKLKFQNVNGFMESLKKPSQNKCKFIKNSFVNKKLKFNEVKKQESKSTEEY